MFDLHAGKIVDLIRENDYTRYNSILANGGFISSTGDISEFDSCCSFFMFDDGASKCSIHKYACDNDISIYDICPLSCLLFPMEIIELHGETDSYFITSIVDYDFWNIFLDVGSISKGMLLNFLYDVYIVTNIIGYSKQKIINRYILRKKILLRIYSVLRYMMLWRKNAAKFNRKLVRAMLFSIGEQYAKITVHGIEFFRFRNTRELFDEYNEFQRDFYFTNCFEYINKMDLNAKYEMLYLRDNGLFFYVYAVNTGKLTAYNYDSYIYMIDKHGIKLNVKYVRGDILDFAPSNSTEELVDAVYYPQGLAKMEGSRYKTLRQHRNNFINRTSNLCFCEYANGMKRAVVRLYEDWKLNAKQNGNTFIVDAKIFKAGLDNSYLNKYVLINDDDIIGFISYFTSGEWAYVYSMKTDRALRNANVYLVNVCWQDICDKHPEVKYINLGAIVDVDWKDDFKMQLKPDILLSYYSNVRFSR